MNETGKIIRDLRIEAGYTQRSLAEALHVTDKAISKWERGKCFPDVSILPRLSLLLDADIDLLISKRNRQEEWVGLIDISSCDFSQTIYDKPLVYYLLSHYLLLGITRLHIITTESNQRYLMEHRISKMGFQFFFEPPEGKNMMVMFAPWFLFGSDLTHQFLGAMASEKSTKLIPQNQGPVLFFCRSTDANLYFDNREQMLRHASSRTLGRGMSCFNLCGPDSLLEASDFVRSYQNNTGLLIGSLEELSYRKGILTSQQLCEIAEQVPYRSFLQDVLNKPMVG